MTPGRPDPDEGPDLDGAGEGVNPYEETRKDMERTIRRLDVLKWIIVGMAVGLAVGGGAGMAALLAPAMTLPFVWTWVGTSALLLLIPALVVLGQSRGDDP